MEIFDQEEEVVVRERSRSFTMTEEHKQNLALGREQSRVIREYLEALEGSQPKRGRRRTVETIEKRLTAIGEEMDQEPDPLRRLQMISEREALEAELDAKASSDDLPELEAAFIEVCKEYSQRKRISYSAWRAAGVDAAVLRKAGLGR